MEEILKILKEAGYGDLATVENGKPYVRPFGFMFGESGKLYFCTNSQKQVYRQLKAQPVIAYAATTKNMVTLRISGEVTFCADDDIDKKQKVIDASPTVKKAYKSADNPILKVFYIEHGTAIIADFSGNPPRTFEF